MFFRSLSLAAKKRATFPLPTQRRMYNSNEYDPWRIWHEARQKQFQHDQKYGKPIDPAKQRREELLDLLPLMLLGGWFVNGVYRVISEPRVKEEKKAENQNHEPRKLSMG